MGLKKADLCEGVIPVPGQARHDGSGIHHLRHAVIDIPARLDRTVVLEEIPGSAIRSPGMTGGDRELSSDSVKPISHSEFLRRINSTE